MFIYVYLYVYKICSGQASQVGKGMGFRLQTIGISDHPPNLF